MLQQLQITAIFSTLAIGASGCALGEYEDGLPLEESQQELTTKQVDIPVRWVSGLKSKQLIEGASLRSNANAEGASLQLTTDGLEPGGTYTLWFAWFNHPEYCTDAPTYAEGVLRCGFADIFDPLTDASFVFGDGLVATGTNDKFLGHKKANEPTEGFEQIAWGTGVLTNPLGAEYHGVLRYHGPEDPAYMPAQITTHNGGCHQGEPYYPCSDDQAAGARHDFPLGCESIDDLDDAEKCFPTE